MLWKRQSAGYRRRDHQECLDQGHADLDRRQSARQHRYPGHRPRPRHRSAEGGDPGRVLDTLTGLTKPLDELLFNTLTARHQDRRSRCPRHRCALPAISAGAVETSFVGSPHWRALMEDDLPAFVCPAPDGRMARYALRLFEYVGQKEEPIREHHDGKIPAGPIMRL